MRSRQCSRSCAAAALLLLAIALGAVPAAADQILQESARVVDGDTLELDGTRIRLWGIDAPERSQTCRLAAQAWRCGEAAAEALSRLLEGRAVRCEPRGRDRYSRMVAVCMVAGRDIAAAMVRDGWALNYERYSDGAYRADQQAARAARNGLWRGQFVPPWQWRHEH